MARLARLECPGEMHYVLLRAHDGGPAHGVLGEAADRAAFLDALRQAGRVEPVAVHAYALLPREAQLLLTPGQAGTLARFMQALGRTFVSSHNARHGLRGSPWTGRFHNAVLEAGSWRLAALVAVDAASAEPGCTSAGQRTGALPGGWMVDPPEFWALGNTPFEREAAYRQRLAAGLPAAHALALRQAVQGGWALGSPAFVAAAAQASGRPARPRLRGRPVKRA